VGAGPAQLGGARVLGGLLALCRSLGLEHPWAMAGAVWCACAGAQGVGTWMLYRLVEERDGREPALLAAGPPRHLGRLPALCRAAPGGWAERGAAGGALLWARRAREREGLREGLWCGVWLGVAFVIRYPSAVFGVPLAVSLGGARRWRALAGFALGAGAVLLGLGVLDGLTWGMPWHSAWRYFHFNISSGGSAAVRPQALVVVRAPAGQRGARAARLALRARAGPGAMCWWAPSRSTSRW